MSATIPTSRRARLVRLSLAALAAAAIAACGGGGGGVGAGGTGITSGTVNGFGSVIIGGVRYDDSSATISREDASDDSKLRLGMSVDVSVDDSCSLAALSCVAHEFEIHSDIAGEVTAAVLDGSGNGTITVMGQVVSITANTFVHRSSGLSSALGLGLGQIVKVHGRRAAALATADWVATYIEIKAATDAGLAGLSSSFRYRLAGTLTGTAGAYLIGGEPVDLSGVTVPAGTAPYVRVRMTPAADRPAGGWVVTEIKSQRSRALEQRSRSRVEVQGYVESATVEASRTVLVINGVDVIVASTGVTFDDGATYAGLATETGIVEVKGSINETGQLVATKVELSDEAEREFHVRPGEVSGVTATTFVVTKTNTDPLTVEFDAGDFDRASAADIGVRILEIKGNIDRSTGRLIATRIKRDD